ncbi:MAG TPA: proprotein convertase P-domain-containing protein [Nannocystaceae bacterium]|nr:proprotein convertase P-domain-containing protein [Nannocystaceae bacterium]
MRRHACLFAVLSIACAADDTDAIVPELGSGKADALDQVDDRGALALATPRDGVFVEDLEFHGYRLAVRPGARVRVEITQAGTAKKLDTTLFVYGPLTDAGFGTTAIAFDDDSGWGKQSRITGLSLDGGEYLVVVGTHDARGRGKYRVQATCENGDCSPLPPVAACPDVVANNILACVATQVADSVNDPETPDLSRADALAICTDGEALGPVFDNLCMGGGTPQEFCAAGFDAFAQQTGPACHDELAPFAVECVFGHEYRELAWSHDVVSGDRRVLSSPAGLGAIEQSQIIAAVQATGFAVTTLDEAFAFADEGEINRTELWDRTSAVAYVVYEFGAGDTSVGAYFELAGSEPVARIGDGFIERCSAAVGNQGNDCTSDADCSVGRCFGDSEGSELGRCTVLSGFGEQTMCSAASECDIGQGLVCAGLTRGDDGICFPAWMRGNFGEGGRFDDGLQIAIPDHGTLERTLLVYGLATVDMDVELEIDGAHDQLAQLTVTLTNPAGNEVAVPLTGGAGRLRNVAALSGFSGDEMVDGTWTLRITDTVAGGTGTLDGWHLRIGSRMD